MENAVTPVSRISVGDWMITLLILAIPIVNLIMLFVWAFGGGTDYNKASFAKAALIWMAISIVLSILFIGALGNMMTGLFG